MKPKPDSKPPNPTTKPSNKPQPQRAVKKENIPVKKQNGETSKPKKDRPKDDLSVLVKSISSSVSTLQEIIKLFKNATPEIIDLITNECSIILECKICKNLFRSLANFMTHKRGFCLGKFEQLFQNHEHSDHVWYSKCRKKNSLSSRSTTRKDILDLIESLKSSVVEEKPAVTVLKDLDQTNEGLFNLRYFAQDPAKEKEKCVTVNSEETPEETEGDASESCRCTFCQKEFPSSKALNTHLKKDHTDLKMCFVCPCCKKYFANAWSVYRHMYKVHRKTSEQVRKLRSQIQKKQVSQEDLEKSRKGQTTSPLREKDQYKAYMEDLKGHGALQHCSECGKKFERKVALISHTAHCHKKITAPPDLLRSLKRKALNPLKNATEKKAKYSTEEMLLRLRALDARVVLTKTDLPARISLKKEKMDDQPDAKNSPKADEEIKMFVQAYQGKDATIPCNSNEFEELLNKIHQEVNHVESVCITDSDENEGTKNKNSESVEINSEEDASQGDNDENESQADEEDSDNEDNTDDVSESQRGDDRGSDIDDSESGAEDDVIVVSDDSDEDDNQDCNSRDGESDGENNVSLVVVKDEKEEDTTLETVDEDHIETQEIDPEDPSAIINEDSVKGSEENSFCTNDINKGRSFFKQDCGSQTPFPPLDYDGAEEASGSAYEVMHIETEVVTASTSNYDDINRIRSPSVDDLENNGFLGFSDIEEEPGDLSRQQISIINNRNKVLLKDFERIPSQNSAQSVSNESTSDGTVFLHNNDSLTAQYELEDGSYIVAKEIVLFNDSEGVCISNMSNSEVLEDSLRNSLESYDNGEDQHTDTRYFAKINGESSSSSSQADSSPRQLDNEDGESTHSYDGNDWLNKKINCLMNPKKKKCLLCLKTFPKKMFVRRHIASHYNINKFKCLINSCNYMSFLRVDMVTHLLKCHKKKEFGIFVEKIYPRIEDFDDSSYIPEPKINYAQIFSNSEKIDLVPEKDKYLSTMIIDEGSLDDLNICEEMELPCVEDSSSKLLTYESLEDENTAMSPLPEREPGHIMMDIFGNKLGDNSQDSALATS